MEKAMNIPYRKSFDENGNVSNPIVGLYPQPFDNRRTRRFSEPRFLNNRKGVHLQQVGPRTVFRKVLQQVHKFREADLSRPDCAPIFDLVGVVKHYLLK